MTKARRRPLADSRGAILAIQIALVVGGVLLWEVLTGREIINPLFFGRPTIIAQYMAEGVMDGTLLMAAFVTLTETLYGFVAGIIVGTTLGLSLWWSRYVARLLEPILVLLNAIPKITLAPILIVLFGVGITMKVSLAFVNVVPLLTLTAYLGVKQADPDLMDLIRSVGGSRWQVFYRVVLPSSYSGIILSMKNGISLAFIGSVVGEFLASDEGLGFLALYGANIFNMSLVMVALLGLMVLALLLFAVVSRLENWLLGWRVQMQEL